ncbi:MAG: sigma-54 dependent transcriptional regulator [Desulfobacteraceae bacterium]|nr:sigma-54 dependent transcriptional regulator [Desulfobacteraceae bacterium]
MERERILVVDDDQSILEILRIRLESEGYEVNVVSNRDEALNLARECMFDLALVDLKLAEGDKDGIYLMQELHQINAETPIIILTAYGTINSAVDAMKRGAYSYLTKPFDHHDLFLQIKNGLEKSSLAREVKRLKALVDKKYGINHIIGKSRKMLEVLDKTHRAAETDSNVYIYGESGTGKELIAKSLHLLSPRKDRPFVAINCASIPEGLLESELFGYEKGAFTGATGRKKGLFSQAHTGTLFLDEISETPASMQVRLLRVLEERQFQPLGSEKVVSVDVRIVAASNKNIGKEMEKGSFREDLYYRLHVIPISLPPLRERKEDIPLLADHFMDKFSREKGKDSKGLSSGAIQKLLSYDWPGNVRELENTIEYAVAMSDGGLIEQDLILQARKTENGEFKSLKEARDDFEKDYISRALTLTGGNVSKAAGLVKKYRADFYDLLKKHNLKPSEFKNLR